MYHNLQNTNNNISILDVTKDQVPHNSFIFLHIRIQQVKLTTIKFVAIFCLSGQEYFYIGTGFINKVLNFPRRLCLKPFRYWCKMQCTFPRAG